MLQGDAAAREDGRAMGDVGPGRGQAWEVVAGRPMQPGMMIEKNGVADDRVRTEHPQCLQPFDRGLAVSPHDFVKLDDALRRMNLQWQPAFASRGRAVTQQRLAAGVDLRRTKHAGEPARWVLAGPVDRAQCPVEPRLPSRLVPLVAHLSPVCRVPPPRSVHWRDPSADAAFTERVEPVLALGGKVAKGGDAALHQLTQRHLVGCLPALGVCRKQRQVFVERAHEELSAADLVGQALQHRLRGGVGMKIDQARHDETAAPVDLDRVRLRRHGADRGDGLAREGEIDVAPVDMARRRRIPGDDP
jgi:hypothetical protein